MRVVRAIVTMQIARHTSSIVSAVLTPSLAKNARLGHPRFRYAKREQGQRLGPPAFERFQVYSLVRSRYGYLISLPWGAVILMFRCIYSLAEQERSDREHILQNFLGARWVSHEIVSDDLQRAFGRGIDVDFEKTLQVIRNLMGTRGGRGGNGPTLKVTTTIGGHRVNLLPSGRVQMAAPILQEIDLPNGQKQVRVNAATPEQLAWALAQVKAKYPGTPIDEKALLASANVTEGYINDPIVHKLELGGPELFRGLLKACFNLLGAEHPERALLPCFNGVRDYIREGIGGAASYARWYASTEFPNLPRLGPADQHIFNCLPWFVRGRGHAALWWLGVPVSAHRFLFRPSVYLWVCSRSVPGERACGNEKPRVRCCRGAGLL